MKQLALISSLLITLAMATEATLQPTLAQAPEPIHVTTKDNRYTLTLNSDYQNRYYDSKNFISARFINVVPNEDLTLLYQSADTIVFAFSIPKPKDRLLSLRPLIEKISERLNHRSSVTSLTVDDREIHMGRVNYRIVNQVDDKQSTELCHLQLALESVDLICANSEIRDDHLEAIIESIRLK